MNKIFDKQLLSLTIYSYKKKITSIPFIVTHVLMFVIPLVIVGIIAAALISQQSYLKNIEIHVITDKTEYVDYLKDNTDKSDDKEDNNDDSFSFGNDQQAPSTLNYKIYSGTVEEIKSEVKDGSKSVAINITTDENDLPKFELILYDSSNLTLTNQIKSELEMLRVHYVFEQNNIDGSEIDIDSGVFFSEVTMKDDALTSSQASLLIGFATAIPFLMLFIAVNPISTIGQDVIYEKTDRVMELILSSISSTKLFVSKILLGFLLMLTELLLISVIVAIPLIIYFVAGDGADTFAGVSLVSFVIFTIFNFILYYLFFAIFTVVFSSFAVDQESGGMWLAVPIGLMVIALYLNIFLGFTPDAPVMKFLSYLPPFSGIIMPTRLLSTDVPIYEPLLSLFIFIITCAIMMFFGNKIFAKAALFYTSRKSKKKNKKRFLFF